MCQKSMEADGADGADRDGSEYKVSEVVKTARTCQSRMVLVWGYFCCL
jgi:hypothetical protein